MSKHAILVLGPGVKRSIGRLGGAFALGVLILAGTITALPALERKTVVQGNLACRQWCDQHTPAAGNPQACYSQCDKYWSCNGSDAKDWVVSCRANGGTPGKFTALPPNRVKTQPQVTLKPTP